MFTTAWKHHFWRSWDPATPGQGAAHVASPCARPPSSAVVSLVSGVLISSSYSACRRSIVSQWRTDRPPNVPLCHYFLYAKEIPSRFLHLQAKLNTQSVASISLGSEVSYFQAKCKHKLHRSCFSQNHFLFFLLLPLSTCKVAHHHSCLRSTMVSLIPGIGCNCDVETCQVFF